MDKGGSNMAVLLFLALFLGTLLWGYSRAFDGLFFSRHSAVISLPLSVLSDDLKNLANWHHWLPWLIYDKDHQLSYEYLNSGVMSTLPSCVRWEGQIIKSGYITLKPARSSEHYFHTLLKAPAFYPSDVHFNIDLTKQKDKTLITIQISGRLPFHKRWKQKNYDIRTGKDAELALLNMLSYLNIYKNETDHKHTAPIFEWLPQTHLAKIDAVTRPFTVANQPMSQRMEQSFHDLAVELGPENPPAGPSFALYSKVDLKHHHFIGRLGIPIQNMTPCVVCPERINLPGYYLQLRYTGPYQHLSLAWHVLYSFMRLNHAKSHHRHYGVEIFEIGPAQTDNPENYTTLVCLPVK